MEAAGLVTWERVTGEGVGKGLGAKAKVWI